MTNIATKRKRSLTWWVLPLAIAALVAVLGLGVASACGLPRRTLAAGGDVVTSLPIGQPDKLKELVDKHAQLTEVRVQEVVGDKTFWVGPSRRERVLVYLEEDNSWWQPVEGGIDVRAGQVVNLRAAITRLPSPEQIQRQWDLTAEAFEALKGQPIYLYVASVGDITIVGGP